MRRTVTYLPWFEVTQLPVPPDEGLRRPRRGRTAPASPLVIDGGGGDGAQAEAAPGAREPRIVVGAPDAVI